MHFACFRCAGQIVRMMKSRIPKPTSGHLDRSFYLGVQRSDQKFHFQVSRGRIRIITFRCPEVGLELSFFWCPWDWLSFSLLDVQRLVQHFHFQVSRGRIRIFTFRCPEVGLELDVVLMSCPDVLSRSGVRFRFQVAWLLSSWWSSSFGLRCPRVRRSSTYLSAVAGNR